MIPIAIHAEPPPDAVAAAARLRPPALVAPDPRGASFGSVTGRVFAGTTTVRVVVDGVPLASRAVAGPGRFSFAVDLPPRDVRVRVVARDAEGNKASASVAPVYGLPRAGRPTGRIPSIQDGTLARRLRSLARAFPGTAAVYVQDLRTGRGAAWNAAARFPAASTLKLAIALEVLRRERARPGPGSSLDGLLRSMLVHSDNASANALLVRLGGSTSGGAGHVNALMRALGARSSLMYGGYEVLTAAAARPIPVRVNEQPAIGIGKFTTAYDLARLHRALHLAARGRGPLARVDGSFTRRDARYLLWVLARVADHGKLDRYLPGSVSVLHKAGWIRQARHDAGLVYWRGGAFVVAVMTWNARGVGRSSDVLAGRTARAALERFRALRREAPEGANAAAGTA
ncbi:MAG TPA: serine hydrolase [Gaiellaceae bacterium]|nr:serine hydrolase [Gaiellaceae bacterium]